MKLVLLLIACLLGAASASLTVRTSSNLTPAPYKSGKLDLCPTCVQFCDQTINILLNIILNTGVVGGCGDLCQMLVDKVPDADKKAVGLLCNVLCDVEGVKEFMHIVEEADLDPIYMCELLHQICLIKDDGDATITSLNVPKTVVYGDELDIELDVSTVNGTGTGQIVLEVLCADGLPLGSGLLLLPQPAGSSFGAQFKATAAMDPDCDPTQGPCEMWIPGNYTVKADVCNGECGSKHPHSALYDKKQATFTLVKN